MEENFFFSLIQQYCCRKPRLPVLTRSDQDAENPLFVLQWAKQGAVICSWLCLGMSRKINLEMVLWLVMLSIVSSCDHAKTDLRECLNSNLILIIIICLCTMGMFIFRADQGDLVISQADAFGDRAASDLAKKFHLAAGKFRWMNPKSLKAVRNGLISDVLDCPYVWIFQSLFFFFPNRCCLFVSFGFNSDTLKSGRGCLRTSEILHEFITE